MGTEAQDKEDRNSAAVFISSVSSLPYYNSAPLFSILLLVIPVLY